MAWQPEHRNYAQYLNRSPLISTLSGLPVADQLTRYLSPDAARRPCGALAIIVTPEREVVASILLSNALFDKPRRIDIPLDRPKPFVRLTEDWDGYVFRYHEPITRRMQYAYTPYWDKSRRQFLFPKKPVLRVLTASSETLVWECEMKLFCFSFGWKAIPQLPADLPDKTPLLVRVVQDTGDLFGELTAECSIVYDREHFSYNPEEDPDFD